MSESGGGFPDLSTILSRVSENPQAMAMLSSLLGGVKESPSETKDHAKEESGGEDAARQKEPSESKAAIALPARLGHGKGGKQDDRRRLLIALKPFLSAERKEALETLLLVLEATSLFSHGKEPPCT